MDPLLCGFLKSLLGNLGLESFQPQASKSSKPLEKSSKQIIPYPPSVFILPYSFILPWTWGNDRLFLWRLIVQNSKVIKEHRVKYLPHHYLPAIQVLLQFLEHTSKAVQCIYKYTLTCILIFFLFFLLIFNCTIIAVWFLPYINLKEPYILWKIYLSPMYTSSFQIFKTVIHKKEMKLLFHGCGYLCPVPECHNHFNSIMCASEHLCFSLLF